MLPASSPPDVGYTEGIRALSVAHKLHLFTCLHSHMSLNSALAARFTDACEIKDVANYGCAGGVSGFIYNNECCEFFDKHEDEIEEVMYDLGISYQDLEPNAIEIMNLKIKAVWFVVENYCQSLAIEAEMDEYLAAA